MLKFIHCADFHLDSPFAGERAAVRDCKRKMLLEAFYAVIELVKKEAIPLCLIAGDLFDTKEPSAGVVAAVSAAFAGAPQCRFVISPGNHDPYIHGGLWDGDFPENVHIFKRSDISELVIDDIGVRVFGWALTERAEHIDPLDGFRAPRDGYVNLCVGHASAGDEKGVYKLCEGTVGTSGLDYLALGHIHARSFARIGDVLYGYSGCACGRDFGECGEKGVYVLTDLGGTLREEFVCTGGQRYYREALDITGCTDTEDIAARINDFIRLRGIRTEDCLRLSLRGRIRSDMRVEPALTEAMCALDYITVTDETLPIADIDVLRSDPGLRGEFFRMLEADILSDDETARDNASLALKLGLAAIDGGNIDEIR